MNRIDRAAELRQHAVAGCVGDPAAVRRDQFVHDPPAFGQIAERPDLVGAHQAAEPFHVGCENGHQSPLGVIRCGQSELPVTSEQFAMAAPRPSSREGFCVNAD
ncbi:MAG: hypothetical protein V4458_04410 [Pseudomonadota bacterium]|nr:hypothetical protein [Afipia sp.]